jgi:hypothetical protein
MSCLDLLILSTLDSLISSQVFASIVDRCRHLCSPSSSWPSVEPRHGANTRATPRDHVPGNKRRQEFTGGCVVKDETARSHGPRLCGRFARFLRPLKKNVLHQAPKPSMQVRGLSTAAASPAAASAAAALPLLLMLVVIVVVVMVLLVAVVLWC